MSTPETVRTRIRRYLGQKVLADSARFHCVHCDLVNYHVQGCPALLQLRQPARKPCPDRDCGTTTDAHADSCGVDMTSDSMHKPNLPGLAPGRF